MNNKLECFFFFFFKQKTAYEIRKGDWSADVCSSDLERRIELRERGAEAPLDDERVAPHRPHLTRGDRAQPDARRQVEDRLVTVARQRPGRVGTDAIERRDVVRRRLRPAPLQEGTVPRREAVAADRDLRK